MAAVLALNILIVDFLDSYTYNIPAFIRKAWRDSVHAAFDIQPYNVLHKQDAASVASRYDGVILSPGPGTVDSVNDLGHFVPALLDHRPPVPVYGVCLGFQAICKHFGGSIRRLSLPHHGLISEIKGLDGSHLGRRATRYHSLDVRLSDQAREQLEILAVASNHDDSGAECIMEVRHRSLPFWGVQYHPESVYSSRCEATVQPFLQAVHGRRLRPDPMPVRGDESSERPLVIDDATQPLRVSVAWQSVQTDVDLLTMLDVGLQSTKDFVLLDSSSKGEWDVLAAADTASFFQYSVRDGSFAFEPLQRPAGFKHEEPQVRKKATLDEVWTFLSEFSSQNEYVDGPLDVPFWGGFVGCFSYEAGLTQLDLNAYPPDRDLIPEYGDIQLIWSTESLAYHKATKTLYAISLRQDFAWIGTVLDRVRTKPPLNSPINLQWRGQCKVVHPTEIQYRSKIGVAQEEIRAGNSYELCLTACSRTRPLSSYPQGSAVSQQDEPSAKQRFQHLRESSPAEFMSLTNLGGVTMLSASPEEFLSYDAETHTARMRPIKGTHPKTDEHGNTVSFQAAFEALHEPKVIAENLMIVDLVRNDLSKVSSDVTCPHLMHVEDIESMYQLISTIEAKVDEGYTAWDLIKHSIPPGSMTGAPKRCSCQILQCLEREPRGLYSGITGYIDVRGNCKMSVNIRNAVRYPGEDQWRIGAGGAITTLSDPRAEWQERQLKARSVSRSFEPGFDVLETVLWDPTRAGLVLWQQHVKRLAGTLKHFGFDPSFLHDEVMSSVGVNGHDTFPNRAFSDKLATWIEARLTDAQKNSPQRLSLTVSVSGALSMAVVPIQATLSLPPISVHLDPCATSAPQLEDFISHKTTRREHYTSARKRAGVEGRNEVLLFRLDPSHPPSSSLVTQARDDDLLTEGSYTNVAVFSTKTGQWITPASDCLPGILRAELLVRGEIIEGEVRRRDIAEGMTIKLFNSVRGVFESVISSAKQAPKT